LGLVLSLASAAALERAASAQESIFGISSWSSPVPTSFGSGFGSRQTQIYPAMKTYVRWHAHAKRRHIMHVARKTRVDHAVQSASAVPQQRSELAERLAAMQKVMPGTLSMFLNDVTLRSSDAVMTTAGIFIFKGGYGEHTSKDFVSLAYSKPIAHHAELAAIQKVSVQHFEVAELEKPKSSKGFENKLPATKTFETIEPKAIRRIAGIQAF
jgi:hypothetical protein